MNLNHIKLIKFNYYKGLQIHFLKYTTHDASTRHYNILRIVPEPIRDPDPPQFAAYAKDRNIIIL